MVTIYNIVYNIGRYINIFPAIPTE